MIKTLIAIMAVTVITATPALAEGKATTEPTAPTTASSSAPATAPAQSIANDRQRYCVVENVTGSRLPTRTCQTRAAWMAQGFDPLGK